MSGQNTNVLSLQSTGVGNVSLRAESGNNISEIVVPVNVDPADPITNISTTYSINHCTVNGYKNEIVGADNATNFKWYVRNITQGTPFSLYRNSSLREQRSPSDGSCDQIEILIEASNNCSVTPQTYTFPSDMCPPYTD